MALSEITNLKSKIENLQRQLKDAKTETKTQERWYIKEMNKLKTTIGERRREINGLKLRLASTKRQLERYIHEDEDQLKKRRLTDDAGKTENQELTDEAGKTESQELTDDAGKTENQNSQHVRSGPSVKCSSHSQTTSTAELSKGAGLPAYPCVVSFKKKSDRKKLPGWPCCECAKWYSGGDGLPRRETCKHRSLHPPPKDDESVWNISFPDSD